MSKFFNTAGLCIPEEHYMVNPLKRLNEVEKLISKKLYFTIHAPRQTGKTTYLHALAQKLNSEGKYSTVVVSFEQAGYAGITVEKTNEILIDCIYRASLRQLPTDEIPIKPNDVLSIKNYLEDWASSAKKPIILLIDEIDALLDNALISVLRQLRDGYQSRPKQFPSSIVLVGLHDVRDYRIQVRENQLSMGSASPFNVKSDSLFLENFSKQEVFELLDQHTTETGQIFPSNVKDEIFFLTNGQPWLTNALAAQIIDKILKNDYSKIITPEMVTNAKNQLILRRDTHLDSLIEKLKEKKVKTIVQAIINGDHIAFDILVDDIEYVRGLGIVSQSSPLEFANPIYAEIIPHVMAIPFQESIPKEIQPTAFLDIDGKLDMEKALKQFQVFYRRNSQAWLDRFEYKESAQHLLLMAFLQRIVNSGGEIIREMSVGNRRLDMLIKYKGWEYALELKIKRDSYTIEDGKEQLGDYLDRLGLNEGFLIIFDPGKNDWEEKLYYKTIEHKGKKIIMVGL